MWSQSTCLITSRAYGSRLEVLKDITWVNPSDFHLIFNNYSTNESNYILSLFSWPIFGSRLLCQMPVNSSAYGLRSQNRDKNWRLSAPEFFARCHLITILFFKHLKNNNYTTHELNFIQSIVFWPFLGSRVQCQMSVNNKAYGFRSQNRDKYWRLSAPEFFARCHWITI